jgi:NAD(P)-dependent dehydrogenase (short-subunit alcohol dehydrogenase family)
MSITTLKGQTILVIGGSSGIGYGVAKLSLLHEASRVIIASSSKAKVDNAVSRLIKDVGPSAESRISGEPVNAGSTTDVRALLNKVGAIDHLVYSSGDPAPLGFPSVDLDSVRSKWFLPFLYPLDDMLKHFRYLRHV